MLLLLSPKYEGIRIWKRNLKDFFNESLKYTAFGKIAEIFTEIFIIVFIPQFSDYASLKLNYLIYLDNYLTIKIESSWQLLCETIIIQVLQLIFRTCSACVKLH